MKMRVLIVDDERPARELIATLLNRLPNIELLGECSNGQEAVTAIKKLQPDLVFLDIQMPRLDGFGVLAQLDPEHFPLIIFVTAFDRYAVRAFEVHALDYLLQPFEYDRLADAVERARARIAQGPNTSQGRILELLEQLHTERGWDRLRIREDGRILFLKPEEIDWIAAEGNYVRLHIGRNSYLLRETMAETEARLAPKKFLRVSRSALVNLERIRECHPLFHGDAALILQDGTRLTLSRVYRENLDRVTGQLA